MKSLDRSSMTAAMVLTAVGGFVDAVGFVHLGGYFVAFMTGNSTRAAVELAGGSVVGWARGVTLVLFFVLGVFLSGVAFRLRARLRASVVPATVAVLIGLAAVTGTRAEAVAAALLAMGMGVLNTVFTRNGEVNVGLTYVTGSLVKLGQALAQAATGGDGRIWSRYLLLWSSISVGAVLGALAYRGMSLPALWLAVPVLIGVTVQQERAHGRAGAGPQANGSPRG